MRAHRGVMSPVWRGYFGPYGGEWDERKEVLRVPVSTP